MHTCAATDPVVTMCANISSTSSRRRARLRRSAARCAQHQALHLLEALRGKAPVSHQLRADAPVFRPYQPPEEHGELRGAGGSCGELHLSCGEFPSPCADDGPCEAPQLRHEDEGSCGVPHRPCEDEGSCGAPHLPSEDEGPRGEPDLSCDDEGPRGEPDLLCGDEVSCGEHHLPCDDEGSGGDPDLPWSRALLSELDMLAARTDVADFYRAVDARHNEQYFAQLRMALETQEFKTNFTSFLCTYPLSDLPSAPAPLPVPQPVHLPREIVPGAMVKIIYQHNPALIGMVGKVIEPRMGRGPQKDHWLLMFANGQQAIMHPRNLERIDGPSASL